MTKDKIAAKRATDEAAIKEYISKCGYSHSITQAFAYVNEMGNVVLRCYRYVCPKDADIYLIMNGQIRGLTVC